MQAGEEACSYVWVQEAMDAADAAAAALAAAATPGTPAPSGLRAVAGAGATHVAAIASALGGTAPAAVGCRTLCRAALTACRAAPTVCRYAAWAWTVARLGGAVAGAVTAHPTAALACAALISRALGAA